MSQTSPDTPRDNGEDSAPGFELAQEPGFDLGPEPAAKPNAAPPVQHLLGPGPVAAPAMAPAYRVLARKYRPSSFEDLIGQEAMVRTLSNAFDLDRIHQAYLLTGVRGVGKTTTARILARAFNYETVASPGHAAVTKPTIHMPELGIHCQAIIESRHIDVIEMDAASNTSVDDVREIIEGARFRPVMARTKVYIIDEVHMLSKSAFNALLKTLEEPPDHVKFLFATTEIDKVPITVRSRCQRFDLRRVEADVMVRHLSGICIKEGVGIEDEALALVARAAEGSVRDALSLLDQAIAHGSTTGDAITAPTLRAMLGVADRTRVIDMFEAVMKGDLQTSLAMLKEQYNQGAEPGRVLADIAEFVHFVTSLKIAPRERPDAAVTADEHARGTQLAASLSMAVLTRAWQMLSKGINEVKDSPRPLAAADMVLVRLAYAADLPSPEDLLRRLANAPTSGAVEAGGGASSRGGGAVARSTSPIQASAGPSNGGGAMTASAGGGRAMLVASSPAPMAVAAPDMEPRVRLLRFEDVVTLAQVNRDIQLKIALERDVRLVRFEEGSIDFALVPGASPQIAQTLMRRLQEWTGIRWIVAVSREDGAPSLKEQSDSREAEKMVGVRANPLVRSVLDRFPGAEIVAIRAPDAPAAPALVKSAAPESVEGADDVGYTDDTEFGDDDL